MLANESRFEDWLVMNDEANIRQKAILLRKQMALHQVEQLTESKGRQKSPTVHWRRRTLELLEKHGSIKIRGKVLEIGAGTGWCAGLMSKRPAVEEVYALDYEETCVHALMPLMHLIQEADCAKIVRVLGSYNSMRCESGAFDFVISMGALHHSENLHATFSECARVLKPGGFLVGLERCEYDTLTTKAEQDLMNQPVSRGKIAQLYGKRVDHWECILEGDNSNHFYRICQYEEAMATMGFRNQSVLFDEPVRELLLTRLWMNARARYRLSRTLKKGLEGHSFQRTVLYPYYAHRSGSEGRLVYDRLLLIAQKA